MLHQIKCQVCGELFYIEEERCPFFGFTVGAKKLKLKEDEDPKKLKDDIINILGITVGWTSASEIKRKMLYDISSADLTSYLEELVSTEIFFRKVIDGETLYTGDELLYDLEDEDLEL